MRYLSLDWIAAVNQHVAASESLAQLSHTHELAVTQVVTDGPEGQVVYHFRVGAGSAEFAPGPAPHEDVRLEQSWQTAVDVATETLPAQEAFINGLVRVTGNIQKLVDNQAVFAALDTAFNGVRADTEYE